MAKSERVKPCAPWRRGFAANQTIQRVRPKEKRDYVLNPHKGTTTFQRFNGDPLYEGNRWNDRVALLEFKPPRRLKNDRYPDTTISYCRWIWSVLEPEKGKRRWDIIEGALKAAEERGQTLQLRLQPYASDDLPAWFWDLGGVRQKKDTSYGFREPEANHPAYFKHWGEFIRAAGERFDGHPNLESFDVAYAGPWGEAGGNTTPATAAKFVNVYLRAFRKTQLLSMLGTHGCRYAAGLTNRKIGWRADCIGDLRRDGRGFVPDGLNWNHMYDAYPSEVVRNGVLNAWQSAPVTLETCGTVGTWFEGGYDVDWIIEQALKYHISVFMPKSCYIPEEWADKIADFNNRMGYRFVLRQLLLPLEVKPGERFKIQVSIDNMGVAPIYRPYRFAYRFRGSGQEAVITSKQDARAWMPGQVWFEEALTAPAFLKPGTSAKLDVGLADPETKQPKVKFAIEDVRSDNWHPMTMVDVVKK